MATRFQRHLQARRRGAETLRKQPTQGRSRVTVEAILTAAAQVFEAHGFAAGTTNRIAEVAGVSIGTLYQYFSDKEAVAVALLERHVADTGRRLDEWVGHVLSEQHDLHGALTDYVREMRELHAGKPRLQHILLEEIPPSERVHRLVRELGTRATRTFAGFLRTYPEVQRLNLEDASYLVTQIVEPLTHHFAAHPGDVAIVEDSFSAELVAMLEAYLTAAPKTTVQEPTKTKRASRLRGRAEPQG
jgi:AcrR family transcriptional regulator